LGQKEESEEKYTTRQITIIIIAPVVGILVVVSGGVAVSGCVTIVEGTEDFVTRTAAYNNR